jgi:hypothetical protein
MMNIWIQTLHEAVRKNFAPAKFSKLTTKVLAYEEIINAGEAFLVGEIFLKYGDVGLDFARSERMTSLTQERMLESYEMLMTFSRYRHVKKNLIKNYFKLNHVNYE